MIDVQLPLDHSLLTPVVRRILAVDVADIESVGSEPLAVDSLSRNTVSLHRVHGSAWDGVSRHEWSAIAKAVAPPENPVHNTPAYDFYWRREALIYQSDLLHDLPAGFAVPHSYSTTDLPDGRVILWLEDIGAGYAMETWLIDDYLQVARHLGQFAGEMMLRRSTPDELWLSQHMLQTITVESARLVEQARQPALWDHPLLRGAFPESPARRLAALWEDQHAIYEALEHQPRIFVHHAMERSNLILRLDAYGDPQSVALDWEQAGIGAPGEDLGGLFGSALVNFEVPASKAGELADLMLISYFNGMSDVGWRDDPTPIRFAFHAAAVLRHVFSSAGWPVSIAHDQTGLYLRETERHWGRPITEVFAHWASVTDFLLNRANDVRRFLSP
jgi:aminoglycoside/choline kinase family phosphotransferase